MEPPRFIRYIWHIKIKLKKYTVKFFPFIWVDSLPQFLFIIYNFGILLETQKILNITFMTMTANSVKYCFVYDFFSITLLLVVEFSVLTK